MNLTELRAKAYPDEKAITEKRNNPASYFIYRPLSWPVTWLGMRLKLSPIFVTGSGMILSVVGLLLLGMGEFLFGAILLNCAYILDQVDGNIARVTGETSIQGAWLDSMVGFIYSGFYLAGLGIGLYFLYSESWDLTFFNTPSQILLFLGIIGSIAILIRKMGVQLSNNSIPEIIQVSTDFSKSAGIYRIPKVLNSFGIFLLLLAVILNVLDEYILFYSLYQVALMVVVMFTIFNRLGSIK